MERDDMGFEGLTTWRQAVAEVARCLDADAAHEGLSGAGTLDDAARDGPPLVDGEGRAGSPD